MLIVIFYFGNRASFDKILSNVKSFGVGMVNLVSVSKGQNWATVLWTKIFLVKIRKLGFLVSKSHPDLFFGCSLLTFFVTLKFIMLPYGVDVIRQQGSLSVHRYKWSNWRPSSQSAHYNSGTLAWVWIR